MQIKEMEYSDLQAVQNINLRNLPENYNMKFYIYQLATNPGLSFICTVDNKTVGYIIGKREEEKKNHGHIISLCVEKDFRKQGIADSLVKKFLETFKKNSNEKPKIGLKVRVSNSIAIEFYKKRKFSIVDTEKKYYSDGEDAYSMECII
ncbi:N-terminal acetyltransferase A complex catalytic subunit ard1 [Gurleya vavrai]